jgi:hypothetical protein
MVDRPSAIASFVSAAAGRSLLAVEQVDQKAEPLLMRLQPVTRAKILMALLALVLVGIALVALVWIGARHLRRIAKTPLRSTRPHDDDWYRKPLIPPDPPSSGGPDAE